MIIKNPKFVISAVKPHQYPESILPEITFVGRSNVGKSSFINSMLNRKALAKVGQTPGKTKLINFFNIDDVLYFVDLPGYGYASVSKSEKAAWGQLAETYLNNRTQLKMVVMLLDIRHTPTKDDVIMYEWIKSMAIHHIIVATKLDKVTRTQINPSLINIKKTLNLSNEIMVIPYSSETKVGREKIWEEIDKCVEKYKNVSEELPQSI